MELLDEVGKEILDALLDLELLADTFLIDEFQEGESLLPLTLACQRLISDEQFEKLSKLDNTDIDAIASVGVKIGQGYCSYQPN